MKEKNMDQTFKPGGYNSVSPYFIEERAQKLIDLLKIIFNAKELCGGSIYRMGK